ncbi:helix-hairpin-helix domain-containing protein [Roseburia hominis]
MFQPWRLQKQPDTDVFDTISEEELDSEDALNDKDSKKTDDSGEEGRAEMTEAASVCVYVCGMVANPGVYTLPEGSRIADAIERAGGMTSGAADTYLNQAALLSDGMKIYVPSKEEEKALQVSGGEARAGEGSTPADSVRKVNLNTASKEELMTLSGIGESKAEGILAYREEQGAFKSIDEVKNVSGIGDGIFQKIKDHITIQQSAE